MPVVMWKIPEPRHRGFKHRNIDELSAAGFLPLIKGEKNSHGCVHGGSQIDDGQTDLGWPIGLAGRRYNPGFALDQQVIRFDVAIRAILSVTGQ